MVTNAKTRSRPVSRVCAIAPAHCIRKLFKQIEFATPKGLTIPGYVTVCGCDRCSSPRGDAAPGGPDHIPNGHKRTVSLGEGRRYLISDLGASFGETGNSITRSKSNLDDYAGTSFIQKVTPEHVDFFLSSRPFFLTAVDVPNYLTHTKMQDVAKRVPRTHSKWLGQLLGQLSAEQIHDCFRAGGYSPEEVEGFAKGSEDESRI